MSGLPLLFPTCKDSHEMSGASEAKPRAFGPLMAMDPCIVVVGGGRVGTYLACKMRQARARVLLKGSGRKKGKESYALQVRRACARALHFRRARTDRDGDGMFDKGIRRHLVRRCWC